MDARAGGLTKEGKSYERTTKASIKPHGQWVPGADSGGGEVKGFGKLNSLEKFIMDSAQEEAAIHDRYCHELLRKHLIPTGLTSLGLEREGYKVEHLIDKNDKGGEVHEWKLYKLVDSSPQYRIKRVISVETK